MKFRSTGNSIRIRLRKSELAQLERDKLIQESLAFPGGASFHFRLTIDPTHQEVQATVDTNAIVVSLPQSTANQWIGTNEVGIECNLPLENGQQLHVLVEKDFPCNDRPGEDKSDTFWELSQEAC